MNTDTKRHIDAARQVLVGVVPNPSAQIDQITYALIYKFMDDMDQAAIKMGDEPSFFTRDLEQYSWARLMDSRVGNQERMDKYVMAFQKFGEAKQLPEIFRGILKSAFLPYRSPETLGLFLKEIDYFDYSHPEELGNAYEYLLSVMGSQGDAGQFRTPRHIIDFIVDVVNPTKDDRILDPACGTGGFLVKSYQHILEQHACPSEAERRRDGKDNPVKQEKPLTPDQRRSLMKNFEGYDIDPGMVRVSQVNMYLHQFKNPKIYQYDTLTSDERWGDKFDVILANPPFMSPKGGIRPHNKFSIGSSRSEVLFVDYIMNHLRPKGKAGIIVPEGIIFQSGAAHKQLRKNLINDGLYAVVSLPSGVFQPYAGVKTSILLFDNEISKQRSEMLFVKVENDGFDLGATKRPISKNDLPKALKILKVWQSACHSGLDPESRKQEILNQVQDDKMFVIVSKSKIAEGGDYNLSGDRYRVTTDYTNAKWPMVKMGEVAEILNGCAFKSEKYINKGIRVIRITNVQKGEIVDDDPKFYSADSTKEIEKYLLAGNDLLISLTGNVGRVGLLQSELLPAGLNQRVGCIRPTDSKQISIKYLFHVLNTELFEDDCIQASSGVAQKNLSTEWLKKYQIPLPPLEIQEQIVAELEGYTGIIAGAKQIVTNWKPKIDTDPTWPNVKISSLIKELETGVSVNSDNYCVKDNEKGILKTSSVTYGIFKPEENKKILLPELKRAKTTPKADNIIISRMNTPALVGASVYIEKDWPDLYLPDRLWQTVRRNNNFSMKYLSYIISSDDFRAYLTSIAGGTSGSMKNISKATFLESKIQLPQKEIQTQIVEKIEAERALVESAKKLITIYEQNTKETISKLWEE